VTISAVSTLILSVAEDIKTFRAQRTHPVRDFLGSSLSRDRPKTTGDDIKTPRGDSPARCQTWNSEII
jgi:hypothetical protein